MVWTKIMVGPIRTKWYWTKWYRQNGTDVYTIGQYKLISWDALSCIHYLFSRSLSHRKCFCKALHCEKRYITVGIHCYACRSALCFFTCSHYCIWQRRGSVSPSFNLKERHLQLHGHVGFLVFCMSEDYAMSCSSTGSLFPVLVCPTPSSPSAL